MFVYICFPKFQLGFHSCDKAVQGISHMFDIALMEYVHDIRSESYCLVQILVSGLLIIKYTYNTILLLMLR